jgi:predicted extracellular nuclease
MQKLTKTLSTLALLGLVAPSAHAQIVMSQVYGGGGSSSAAASYKNDFIELYNNGLTTVDLTGYSVQYASAGSTSGTSGTTISTVSLLTGTIASHDYFLIQSGTAGTGGADLPAGPGGFAYNGTAALNLAAASGKVFLANNGTTVMFTSGTTTAPMTATYSSNVVDFVAYGTVNAYDGAGAAPTESTTLSDSRTLTAGIYADTNNNLADFTSGTPTPHVGAYNPASAPEPSSIVSILLGAGALGLIAVRRRTTNAA